MSEVIEKSVETGKKVLKTTVKALAVLSVVSWASTQASDLIKECDFNGNLKIDKVFKEKICEKKYKLVEKKEKLAEKKKKLAEKKEGFKELVQILAILWPEELEKEIFKLQDQIDNEKDEGKKKRLEEKLDLLKKELLKVKWNVA